MSSSTEGLDRWSNTVEWPEVALTLSSVAVVALTLFVALHEIVAVVEPRDNGADHFSRTPGLQ